MTDKERILEHLEAERNDLREALGMAVYHAENLRLFHETPLATTITEDVWERSYAGFEKARSLLDA